MITPRNITYRMQVDGLPTFYGAYCLYKEACAEEGRKWNIDTQDQYESFLIKLFVPRLRKHDETPMQDYRREDYLAALEEIAKAGKNGTTQEYEPYEKSTLDKHLHIIKTIVKVASDREYFTNVFTEEALPQHGSTNRIARMRQLWMTPKSLSPRQEQRVIKYILKLVHENSGVGIALLLMYALGLRNEESCGVNFGHIRRMQNYPDCYYLTIPQTTVNHTNKTKLGGKTYNAGRNIPIPSRVIAILLELRSERMHLLQKKGYDPEAIDTLPIVCRKGDPFTRCGADDVTAAATKMFIALGMRDSASRIHQYLQQDLAAVKEDGIHADEFALVEKSPTAYLLRRNFATHLAILMLSQPEIEYIMGHTITDLQTERSHYLDERALYVIKLKLDQRPLLGDICSTPTIPVSYGPTQLFNRYSQELLIPAGASRIHISAVAKEPGDPIHITVTPSAPDHIRAEVYTHRSIFPLSFPSAADVLKAYHEQYTRIEDPE